jgi:lipid-A-disaccharide synthase
MKILVSALDPSGNLHLKKVVEKLPPSIQMGGVFSPEIGKEPTFPNTQLNVMGFVNVLPKLKTARQMATTLTQVAPQFDKVLLIDAPSFNLPLAKAIKRESPSTPIYYYILPKVWVWKRGRIAKVEQFTDRQFYIFPFEREFWKRGEYLGNPLLDILPPPNSLTRNPTKIAFLPGSRPGEIKNLMPLFRELNRKLEKEGFQGEVVIPPHLYPHRQQLYGDLKGFTISQNPYYTLLTCRFAYICSGTATLEAVLLGTPMTLLYKANRLDYFLAKLLLRGVKYVGLANIIAHREGWGEVHREYIQYFPIGELLQLPHTADPLHFQKWAEKLRSYFQTGSSTQLAKILMGKEN